MGYPTLKKTEMTIPYFSIQAEFFPHFPVRPEKSLFSYSIGNNSVHSLDFKEIYHDYYENGLPNLQTGRTRRQSMGLW